MKTEIRKIRIGELEDFLKSEAYRQFEVVPITSLRAKSYTDNPNAEASDVALLLAFSGKKLLAFRSIFAGKVQTENHAERFGWCSGAWVHPDFRRKGISSELLTEALADWNGKLMLTNYSPETENLFLKSGKFFVLAEFSGFRGYLFPKTQKLFEAKKSFRFFLKVADIGISMVSSFRTLFCNKKNAENLLFETLAQPDETCYNLLKVGGGKSIFRQDVKELKWIFDFPWVSETPFEGSEKYPFSACVKSFRYYTVKIFESGEFKGFFVFSVRDGNLKTLFNFFEPGLEAEVAHYLKKYCCEHKIEVISVYNNEISQQLFKRKFPFLHAKKYGQKIYSSFHIQIGRDPMIQDGEGDVVFT